MSNHATGLPAHPDAAVDNVVPAPDEDLQVVVCAWCEQVLHSPSDPDVDVLQLPTSHGLCEPCRKEHFGGIEGTPRPAPRHLRLVLREPDLPAAVLPRPRTSRCLTCREILTLDARLGWLHPGGGATVLRCTGCGLRSASPAATFARHAGCPECAGRLVDDHEPAPEDAA